MSDGFLSTLAARAVEPAPAPIVQRTGLWCPGLVIGYIAAAAARILYPSPSLVLFVLFLTAGSLGLAGPLSMWSRRGAARCLSLVLVATAATAVLSEAYHASGSMPAAALAGLLTGGLALLHLRGQIAADMRTRAAAWQTRMRDRLGQRIVVLPIWGLDPEGSGSTAA